MKRLLFCAGSVLMLLIMVSAVANAAPCESLRSLSLPRTTITAAELVRAGPFQAPGNPPPAPITLPAHCRVAVVLTPSSDSHIEVEVWLPIENWNRNFEAVGGGGWAGFISYAAMAQALNERYATASTDTGHTGDGGDALFAIGHPEKLNDFAYRAIHEMTVSAKAIVTAFYGQPAKLSYFNGCSTGGRQGLMEAQKYPQDYDAIVTGAPVISETRLSAWHMWMSSWIVRNAGAALTPSKLEMVNKAVLKACDAADGVTDGLLNDPRGCTFDIGTLQCHGTDTSDCLTAGQLASMKHAYGAATLKNGATVFPGKELGSELGLGVSVGGQALDLAMGDFQIAYGDAAWDVKSFDIDRDLPVADAKVGVNNAIDPNLSAFKAHGSKLLLYQGWNDQLAAPRNTIDYYDSVQSKMRGPQNDFVRLFMAPGMQHCGGGPGPNQVNWMAAMERWREGGTPPVRIEAAHVANNRIDMTRPLCPYPQVAVYNGAGSTNDAANFLCKAP